MEIKLTNGTGIQMHIHTESESNGYSLEYQFRSSEIFTQFVNPDLLILSGHWVVSIAHWLNSTQKWADAVRMVFSSHSRYYMYLRIFWNCVPVLFIYLKRLFAWFIFKSSNMTTNLINYMAIVSILLHRFIRKTIFIHRILWMKQDKSVCNDQFRVFESKMHAKRWLRSLNCDSLSSIFPQ